MLPWLRRTRSAVHRHSHVCTATLWRKKISHQVFTLPHFKRVSHSFRFENTTTAQVTGYHMALDCCFFRTCFHGHSVDLAVLSPSHVSTFQRAMASIPHHSKRRILAIHAPGGFSNHSVGCIEMIVPEPNAWSFQRRESCRSPTFSARCPLPRAHSSYSLYLFIVLACNFPPGDTSLLSSTKASCPCRSLSILINYYTLLRFCICIPVLPHYVFKDCILAAGQPCHSDFRNLQPRPRLLRRRVLPKLQLRECFRGYHIKSLTQQSSQTLIQQTDMFNSRHSKLPTPQVLLDSSKAKTPPKLSS